MLSSRLSVISSSDLPAAAALAASSAAAAAVSVCATTIPPTPAHMDEDKQERMDDHTDNTHDSMHSTPSSVAHGSVCLSFGSGSLDRDRSGSIAAPQPPHPPHQSVEVQPATHQQRNQITGHTEQAQGEQNTNAAAAATEPVDVPQSLMSSSIATACVVSPPQPPLTPIRKRNFEEEEEKDTSESREEQTRNGATHYAAARSRSISPSSSTSSPAAAAATVSASASSSISWPWYMVTAVSGAANEAYSDFVPSNLSFGSDGLPDVEEVDWWGMGTEMSVQVAVEIAQRARMEVDVGVVAHDAIQTDESKEHEQKMDSDQASKRQRLCDQHVSPSSSSSSSPSHSRAPSDPHALNIFGSMGQDSHFCVSNSRIGCAVAGVADGVGGWRDSGIDSGQISRAIMKTARDIAFRMCMDAAAARAESGESQAEPFTLNPSEILTSAYLAVKASGKVEAGSTTACIVALTPVPVTTQADTNSKHTTRIRSNPTTAAHDMSQINLSPSVPPVTPIVSLEVAASPSTVSVSNFLYSSPAMYDLLTAMVDVNATYVASEVGHTHIEVSETTTTGVHHPVWGQLTSQPIEIPTNNPSVAIDVAPSNDTSLSPSPVRDLLAATRPLVPSEDTVYLSAANLGDSGYMILRRDSLGAYRVVQMSDLQRTGRTVKQLAIIPPRFQNDSFCDDRPEEAELDAHLVKENDILILGSDGLWSDIHGGPSMRARVCPADVDPSYFPVFLGTI